MAGPVNVIILHLLMGVNNVKDHSGKENDYVTITSAQVTDCTRFSVLITAKKSCSCFACDDVSHFGVHLFICTFTE